MVASQEPLLDGQGPEVQRFCLVVLFSTRGQLGEVIQAGGCFDLLPLAVPFENCKSSPAESLGAGKITNIKTNCCQRVQSSGHIVVVGSKGPTANIDDPLKNSPGFQILSLLQAKHS